MTKKERIYALVEGKQPDAQPYHFDLTLKMKDRLAEYYRIETEAVERFIGNHLLYISYSTPGESKKGTHAGEEGGKYELGTFSHDLRKLEDSTFVDEFGVTWNNEKTYHTGDWGMVDHPVKNMKLEGYAFPDGSAPGRFLGVENFVRKNPERFNVVTMIGIFDVAWRIASLQDILMSMVMEDQTFINTMLDKALEFNLGVIDQIPPGIDGVRFLEDWGRQKGLIMGLKHWRRLFKPRLREMYAATREKGLVVMAHSCGDNTLLFPDLIELGVDIFDPLQPEVMDVSLIKKEYGKDLVLFGGLGSQSMIPLGTPEAVLQEAKERLALLGEGGKYLLGPAGSIPTEAPIENVVALVEFCKNLILEG
jgi:uroporphyrinogen decarboxylase